MTSYQTIDGTIYKQLIFQVAYNLENSKEEINHLNVFPVPDGDTGSNMSQTVRSAVLELEKTKENNLSELSNQTAKAMLCGARGNSGVITSLLFRGIAKGFCGVSSCDGITFAKALSLGYQTAYDAVESPAEGTILSVVRKCSETALKVSKEKNSFEYVLQKSIESAKEALDETILQNPVLKKAGVVDAGGYGWLIVLQSMLNVLQGKKDFTPISHPKADFSAFETNEITYSYCTEVILDKTAKNCDEFHAYLKTVGDSLVFVEDEAILKVHVHTNVPQEVLTNALSYGTYRTVKVENMKVQHTSKIEKPLQKYGVVAVCSGEGFAQIFKELGATRIVSGGQSMNPSTEEILREIEQTDAQNVFVLPNNKNIILSAQQCKELSQKNIVILPTKSIPQGINAMLGFAEDATPEENEEQMKNAFSSVDTMEITRAVKTTQIDGVSVSENDFLTLYNHQIVSAKSTLATAWESVVQTLKEKGKTSVCLYYGKDATESEAQTFADALQKSGISAEVYEGAQPLYPYILSIE